MTEASPRIFVKTHMQHIEARTKEAVDAIRAEAAARVKMVVAARKEFERGLAFALLDYEQAVAGAGAGAVDRRVAAGLADCERTNGPDRPRPDGWGAGAGTRGKGRNSAPGASVRRGSTSEAILRLLADAEDVEAAGIVGPLVSRGISENTVRRTMARLSKLGLIEKTGEGWRRTPAGCLIDLGGTGRHE